MVAMAVILICIGGGVAVTGGFFGLSSGDNNYKLFLGALLMVLGAVIITLAIVAIGWGIPFPFALTIMGES